MASSRFRFRDPRRVSIVRLGMALAIVPALLLLCVTFHTADIRNDDDNYNNNHEQAVSLKTLHRRSLLQSGNGLYVDAAGAAIHAAITWPFVAPASYLACAITNSMASNAQPVQSQQDFDLIRNGVYRGTSPNVPAGGAADPTVNVELNETPCDYRLCTSMYTPFCRRRR